MGTPDGVITMDQVKLFDNKMSANKWILNWIVQTKNLIISDTFHYLKLFNCLKKMSLDSFKKSYQLYVFTNHICDI